MLHGALRGLFLRSRGAPADPGALAYFAAAVTAGSPVSPGRKILINNTFSGLRSSGWLARLDRLCFPAAESQAQGLIDWITNATYTITGGMSFVADRGLTGNTTTGFIDTGLAPSGAVKYTNVKGMFGVAHSSSRAAGQTWCSMGTGSATVWSRIEPWWTDNNRYSSVNVSTGNVGTGDVVHGIYMASRPNSANQGLYKGTLLTVTGALAAAGLSVDNFFVSATKSGTSGTTMAEFSGDGVAGFWIGDGATNDADQAVLYNIISSYLTAIGAV